MNYTCTGHWLYDFYGDYKRRKEEGEEKIEEKIETQSERMFCLTGFKGKRRQITDLYFQIALKESKLSKNETFKKEISPTDIYTCMKTKYTH